MEQNLLPPPAAAATAMTAPHALPGLSKAAIFLMGVGDDVSSELLRRLEPEEVRRITREVSTLDSVAPWQMMEVFREFTGLVDQGRFFARGGADCARRMLERALGPEPASEMMAGEQPAPAEVQREFSMAQGADPEQLAAFLRGEHPQTVALVLCNLPPEQAGPLMNALPDEVRPQVALRMATLDRISPDVVRRIAEGIGNRLKSVRQVSKSDGIRALATLLNHVEPASTEAILNGVNEQNQAVAAAVRNLMFVFEDLATIDQEGIKALLGRCDRKALTVALKGTSAELRAHFTGCMSQNAALMLAEDMEALGPVRIRDVEAAQQQVITTLRQLQSEGAVTISRGGSDDYVE
jgi:flagellar motor switch protein FliG